jgi:glycosyltransferase involved in cell wall biosynthesis
MNDQSTIGGTIAGLSTSSVDRIIEHLSEPMKPKRILLICLGNEFGGTEIYLEGLIALLRGHSELYILCSHPELIHRATAMGLKVLRLFRAERLLKVGQLLAAMAVLPYILLRHDIDIVQVNGYSEILLLPIARLLGRRAIATRHLTFDIEPLNWRVTIWRRLARLLYRVLAPFASQINCVSEVVGRQVREFVPASKVTVIPNWVSVPVLASGKSDELFRDVNVLYVGRLAPHKGVHLLIEALRTLSRNGDRTAVRLTIVGDGECRQELQHLAEGLNVDFVGFQKTASPYYLDADIYVNPSLGPEGMPLVSLEAMAHRLPCILSDLPVHTEISLSGSAALLFESGDAVDLAHKLTMLLDDRKAREHYATYAFAAIEAKHTAAVAREAYFRAFHISEVAG